MVKQETAKFLKKIKAHYQNFIIEDYVIDEWHSKLKPYEYRDVLEKFEEHLKGEYADRPPMLHYITKFLRTKEEKEKAQEDYKIRCNLCNEEMYLSDYENKHYRKCLLIKTLIPILKEQKNEEVSYEELDKYSTNTLDKIWEKYKPIEISSLNDIFK